MIRVGISVLIGSGGFTAAALPVSARQSSQRKARMQELSSWQTSGEMTDWVDSAGNRG